jgi:hypothetical protein
MMVVGGQPVAVRFAGKSLNVFENVPLVEKGLQFRYW